MRFLCRFDHNFCSSYYDPLNFRRLPSDAELLGWLKDDLHVFLCELISGYSSSFERPFLAGRHKLEVSRAIEYKKFVTMWADFVED